MNVSRQALVIVGFSLVSLSGFAQQPGGSGPGTGQLQVRPEGSPDAANRLVLDVVVTDRSGNAVKGLEEKDFAVFDDGHSRRFSPSDRPGARSLPRTSSLPSLQ
jgi:hypothetical protein